MHDGYKSGELKLKKPSHLKEVLSLARTLLVETRVTFSALQEELKQMKHGGGKRQMEAARKEVERLEDEIRQWEQVRGVLEMLVSRRVVST